MDIRLQKNLVGNPLEGLRRAGYFPFRDPKSGEQSFVCRLGPDFYPRFHLYVTEDAECITFSLHLDQKQASYRGTNHMHNGEYEGEHITKEMERVRGWILHLHQERISHEDLSSSHDREMRLQKKSWWKFWE